MYRSNAALTVYAISKEMSLRHDLVIEGGDKRKEKLSRLSSQNQQTSVAFRFVHPQLRCVVIFPCRRLMFAVQRKPRLSSVIRILLKIKVMKKNFFPFGMLCEKC